MKKITVASFALVCACVANAAYLHWQVDPNSSGLTSSGDTYYFNGKQVTGAKVVAQADNGGARWDLTTESAVSDSALSNPVGIATAVGSESLYANLSTYTEGYSYYIELMSDNTTIAVSQGLKYDEGLAQISQTLGGDTVSGGSQLARWSGGSAYAVPEPTGALLVLIGAAMLGLKRRKV